MFHLYSSNRTEALAEHLATVIDAGGGHDLFTRAIFLVQSREMERLLGQFLADRFGVWGSSRYLLPMRFLDYLCEKFEVRPDGSSYDREVLTWRLELLLRDLDEDDDRPLASYLAGERPEAKRFQLGRRIAQLFDQYQIMRPELIRSWDRGTLATTNPGEAWQFGLWRRLRQTSGDHHRGEIIAALIDRLKEFRGELPADLRRIFVFGLHTLPPLFLEVLRALSAWSDIHLFLLVPCSLYWGDMKSRRAMLRHLGEGGEAEGADYHPLLVGLGRQGADFQELLLEHIEEMAEGPDLFVRNQDQGCGSLLHRLQDDLLDGRCPGGTAAGGAVDSSLTVVSCHSRMRETAVLRDHILKWLTDDPELGLHEIVVMAPDIQQYADLIPALFADVAHDISDCRSRRENRRVEIFSRFLELFRGRFNAAELLDLLEQPEVARAYALGPADLELIEHWLVDVGIRWGLSAEQRRQDGLPAFAAGTWQDGLERMLLGLASGAKEPIDALVPYVEVEGGAAEVLGSLCRFVELVEQGRRAFRGSHSLSRWSELLHELSVGLFGADDSAESIHLQGLLAALGEKFGPHHQRPVSFEAILQWFSQEADQRSSAGFMRGRLTFCSMLPMRSIPFQVICLLGLNDGEFPKQDQVLPFDLLAERYRKGDRSRRADDRYQFLEAILAARQRLYLSYVGQSIRSNEEIPPSPVVSELLEALARSHAAPAIVTHPLQPFNAAYFSGRADLFSHDRGHCRTAQSFRTVPQRPPPAWLEKPVEPPLDRVHPLGDLLGFFANPQRFFISNILGMRLDGDADQVPDHEPFSLEALDRHRIGQHLLGRAVAGHRVEPLFAELQQRQVLPLGYPGRRLFGEVREKVESMVDQLARIGPGNRLDRLDFLIDLGPLRCAGSLDHLYENGQLLYRWGTLKGRDLLQGWLMQLLAGAVLPARGPTWIVGSNGVMAFSPECGGEGALAQLLELFLEGCRLPSKLHVEPAFNYCDQVLKNRGRGRKDPLKRARETLDHQLERGYAKELQVLFAEAAGFSLLDHEFVRLCEDFVLPVMEMAERDIDG